MNLPPALVRTGERIRFYSAKLGIAVQNIVLTVLLFNVYLFGLGMTKLVAMVGFRKYLQLYNTPAADSYWIEAKGYSTDPERLKAEY